MSLLCHYQTETKLDNVSSVIKCILSIHDAWNEMKILEIISFAHIPCIYVLSSIVWIVQLQHHFLYYSCGRCWPIGFFYLGDGEWARMVDILMIRSIICLMVIWTLFPTSLCVCESLFFDLWNGKCRSYCMRWHT